MIDGEGWIGWTSIELPQISYCLWKYFDDYVGSDIEEVNVLLAPSTDDSLISGTRQCGCDSRGHSGPTTVL